MMNLTQTIRKLSEAQKIRLLTDIHSLAEPELGALGVPTVRCGSPKDVNGGAFPAPSVLARSWDGALLSDVAEAQCRILACKGIGHVFLPEAKTRVTLFGDGLAEDPVLSGDLARACLLGASRAGLSASLAGFGLTPLEELRLGTDVSRRNRYTFLEAPYTLALRGEERKCAGIVTREPSDAVPEEIRRNVLDAGGYIFCLKAEGAETVKSLAEGKICLSGSPHAVQSALHNYRRLTSAIQLGKATTGELEDACAAGEAISEETLEAALERLLRFAEACHQSAAEISEDPAAEDVPAALKRRALLSSTVLLENRTRKKHGPKMLPLRSPRKVCLVGDLLTASGQTPEAAVELLRGAGCKAVTYARGYDFRGHRNEGLLNEAVQAASEADVVILLLGMDALQERRSKRERRAALPADQLALCDAVSRLNKDVVAVVSAGGITPDLSFVTAAAHPFKAVLMAPLDTAESFSVLTEVLMGKASPSGRLATSICARESCPEIFRDDRTVGPFVGYRYYDSLGGGALYPFGHGLTYTNFRYAGLKIHGDQVSFTVKNTGKLPCAEVAQVYLGLRDSAILRPRRELVSYARVELAPGESKTVTLPLTPLPVCTEEGVLLTEQGTYVLSVGPSVSKACLETTFSFGSDPIPADGKHPEDYLSSLSNILSQHYLMEAEYLSMKPSLRNLLFGSAALVLAASVKAYDVLSHTNSLFLDIIAGVLALGAVACFILEILDRRHQHALEDARREEAEAEAFKDATAIDVPTAAAMYADEDRKEREAAEESEKEEKEKAAEMNNRNGTVDPELTLDVAAGELAILAREKGITVEDSTLQSIFASLAVSRLAVVQGMDDKRFSALISLLGEYFACPAAVEPVRDDRSETDLLFNPDETGALIPSNTLRSIISARNASDRIHIAALTNVDPLNLSAYFVPFSRHAHSPYSGQVVECHGGEGAETSYVLSENLWFILNLKPDATICSLPAHITEIATINRWSLELGGSSAAVHSEFRRFSYAQMEHFRRNFREKFSADEEIWKKLDRLENFAHRLSGFRMSNKHWLGLEMYMAILTAFGVEENAARDEAMAVKLMPSLTSVLSGKITRGERSLSEVLDTEFGEDHTALCRKAIKDSGADLT